MEAAVLSGQETSEALTELMVGLYVQAFECSPQEDNFSVTFGTVLCFCRLCAWSTNCGWTSLLKPRKSCWLHRPTQRGSKRLLELPWVCKMMFQQLPVPIRSMDSAGTKTSRTNVLTAWTCTRMSIVRSSKFVLVFFKLKKLLENLNKIPCIKF